jgi:hypothetical protein
LVAWLIDSLAVLESKEVLEKGLDAEASKMVPAY